VTWLEDRTTERRGQGLRVPPLLSRPSNQYSTNLGQTFSAPVQVSQGTDTAVMPWLAAGDARKVDLVYYQATGYSGKSRADNGGVREGGALCTGNRDLYDDFGIEASPTTGLASIVYSDDQCQNVANHKPNPIYGCTTVEISGRPPPSGARRVGRGRGSRRR
jgi:hypothetical protein